MSPDRSIRSAGRTKAIPFVRRQPGEPRFPAPGATVSLNDGRIVRMETAPCCICGTGAAVPIMVVKDWRYGLTPDPFLIVRCRLCGLVYLNPRPSSGEIGLLYPSRYYEQRHLSVSQHDPVAPTGPASERISSAGVAEQAALCGSLTRGRVLDVGCATGVFLLHMRNRGWEVQGVEVSPDAAGWGARELALDIVNETLTRAALPSAHFDAVTFWASLEHVHDPLSYLVEARRILKPGGRAVILMQNFASPTVRWLHWGLDPPRHLYHFTPRTLGKLLVKAGFDSSVEFRARTRIMDGTFDRQVARIGRRLHRSFKKDGGSGLRGRLGAAAGWSLARGSRLLAPVSWALTAAGLNGVMIAIARTPVAAAGRQER